MFTNTCQAIRSLQLQILFQNCPQLHTTVLTNTCKANISNLGWALFWNYIQNSVTMTLSNEYHIDVPIDIRIVASWASACNLFWVLIPKFRDIKITTMSSGTWNHLQRDSVQFQIIEKFKMQMDSVFNCGSHETIVALIRARAVPMSLTTSTL